MADWKLAQNQDTLVTFGLGSCVGLGLLDEKTKSAAMAHIMLPDSKQLRFRQETSPAKFADTAIMIMLKTFEKMGISKQRLKAKIVGGANMFIIARSTATRGNFNVGQRNVAAVKEQLEQTGIPLVGEDTGGSVGRSVEFFAKNGIMRVRTALAGERDI
ncbi:chemotaxis protein CheD [bacterium]|nr:chemotaxis protein CheD [bacterium]